MIFFCIQDVHTVVMLEQELPSVVQLYLSHPIWSKRITILIGSPLRLADLERARARTAYACFIHSTRDTSDPDDAVSTCICTSRGGSFL